MPATATPPSPPRHWLLGHLPEFRRDMLAFFTRCAREYGDLVPLQLGPRKVFLASHPDFVEQVLVTENRKFGKSFVFELLRPMLGNGLLNSEGEFWLRQRRLIQPAFTKSSVNSYAGMIVDFAKRTLAEWRDGGPVDLHREMTRLTLGIVGKTLMDIDLTDVSIEIAAPLEEAMRDFSRRFESAWHFPPWVPTPRNRRRKINVAKLDKVVNRIIHNRRQSNTDPGDLLSKLIHARDEVDQSGMTDKQLRDEVMTLFLAGHETTANALAWTWYLLAQHPAVENRLLEELATVVGDRFPDAADVPTLIYTEAVIKESMRLYPPAYAFSRRVHAETTIGGYPIPKDSAVIMSQWVIHRDPRWWDEPDSFHPERWLQNKPERDDKRSGQRSGVTNQEPESSHSPVHPLTPSPVHPAFPIPHSPLPISANDFVETKAHSRPPYAYFPFGGGPRVCIGNTFAMLEAILVVATIAPRIRMQLIAPEKVRPWPAVTLRPRGSITATLHARQPQPA